jgi:hypothetical protein
MLSISSDQNSRNSFKSSKERLPKEQKFKNSSLAPLLVSQPLGNRTTRRNTELTAESSSDSKKLEDYYNDIINWSPTIQHEVSPTPQWLIYGGIAAALFFLLKMKK